MKKRIVIFLILLVAGQARAQVAKWVIQPNYDSIYYASGANLIITDSTNTKTVWTFDGKRLFSTNDLLFPFSEGFAVTTKRNSKEITGFYATNGKFTSMANYAVSTAHNYPTFSGNYLLVTESRGYHFANSEGVVDDRVFLMAYPFLNGYASCIDYVDSQKPKKGVKMFLINENRKEVTFTHEGKNVKTTDVEFVSSVNDDGLGVVVVKHNLYFFEGEKKDLKPILFSNLKGKEETDLRFQAKLDGALPNPADTVHVLYAKCGKTSDQISITFDNLMMPVEIKYNITKEEFTKKKDNGLNKTSSMVKTEKGGLYGLAVGSKEVLPAQFDDIFCCFGNHAFVKSSGKQGLLYASDQENFEIKINDNEKIAFRHKSYKTKIRIDMPSTIPAEIIDINVVGENMGCLIDKKSIVPNNTQFGNYAEYDCVLTIPKDLTEKEREILYPIQIISDGIRMPLIQHKAVAWHLKYLNVDISDQKTDKSTFSCMINILGRNYEKETYPIDVAVYFADTINTLVPDDPIMITDTQYKCSCDLSNSTEGVYTLIIEITEDGCPSYKFPYEFSYSKPSAKNKYKGDVKIKEKENAKEGADDDNPFDVRK